MTGFTLQDLTISFDNHDPLSPLRKAAWEKFSTLGLPSKSDEAFRYVRLGDLYNTQFFPIQETSIDKEQIAHAIFPESVHSHLVFVNGHFCPHLSDLTGLPAKAVLQPLSQAMRSHGHFLKAHLQYKIKDEKDPFALLNLALSSQGIFFYIPPKLHIECPVQCLYVTTADVSQVSVPRVHLMLGAFSSMKYIATHHTMEGNHPHCCIPFLDLVLEEGAHVSGLNYLSCALSSAWCFDNLRAQVKGNASLNVLSMIEGSKAMRHHAHAQLTGENGAVDLKGLWMLRQTAQAHAHVTVDHMAPHTRSNQLFKGILLDASQSSFEGKILVRPVAQKTEAYQLNNHLILGPAAIAHSKPNLEIFADDVKASHGSTIARPEASQLFYLKSRGIEEKLAHHLLMAGFYREIIDQIPYTHLRKNLDTQLRGVL